MEPLNIRTTNLSNMKTHNHLKFSKYNNKTNSHLKFLLMHVAGGELGGQKN